MTKFKNWALAHKPAAIGIIAVVIIAIVAICVAFAMPKPVKTTKVDAPPAALVEGKGKIDFNVKADDGWTKDSTPAIAHITGSKEDKSTANDNVDFYHAINATEDNHGKSSVDVPAGDYKIEFVSPVNRDGSAYEVYDTGKPITVTVEATKDSKADSKSNAAVVKQEITKIPADKVTDEMLKDIIDKVNVAVQNGDETLKGDAGKAVVDKLEDNVKANPNASEDTQSEAAKTSETTAVSEPAKTTAATTTPNPVNQSSQNTAPASTNNSKPVKSKTAPAQKPNKPQPQYREEKVWIPNVVTVVDTPAQSKRVVDYVEYIFPADGYVTRSGADADNHSVELLRAGKEENFTVREHYKTVTTPAVTHQEDHGHWEVRKVPVNP